jgi:glycosyltransferase involved in cell wall biosynthesis
MDYSQRQHFPRIAYLIKCFPRTSETFILHEILELEHQGLLLRIFSLYEPSTTKVPEAVQEVRAPVTYIPRHSLRETLALLIAAARRFLKAPWRFLCITLSAIIHYRQPFELLKHLLYAAYLAGQFEREGITHVHAHYANTPTAIAQFVHQFTGISYSFTAHAKDIYLSRPAALADKMRMAHFVVTCTAYNQRYLAALADQGLDGHIHCIYHGLNLRAFPADVSVPPAHPLILTVARLVEKKGLPYLLHACRMLTDQGYDFTCRIVGEGSLRPVLEQEIRDLRLTGRVELWGAERHEQVIEMYRHATLVALPCVIGENGDRDGIPNVLVESLYMGVPVVSTPVSGIPELITPEVNGLLVAPRDSAALAAAIGRLLADPRLCSRLALAGRQTVLARFDMARNVTRLLQLLLDQGSTGDLPPTAGKGFAVHTVPPQNTLSNEIQSRAAYNSYKEYMP